VGEGGGTTVNAMGAMVWVTYYSYWGANL